MFVCHRGETFVEGRHRQGPRTGTSQRVDTESLVEGLHTGPGPNVRFSLPRTKALGLL